MKPAKSAKRPPNREDKFAKELWDVLSDRGAILDKVDLRRIRQAFERHFKAVFSATYCHPKAVIDALRPLACLEEGELDPDAKDDEPMYSGNDFPTVGQVRAARQALEAGTGIENTVP